MAKSATKPATGKRRRNLGRLRLTCSSATALIELPLCHSRRAEAVTINQRSRSCRRGCEIVRRFVQLLLHHGAQLSKRLRAVPAETGAMHNCKCFRVEGCKRFQNASAVLRPWNVTGEGAGLKLRQGLTSTVHDADLGQRLDFTTMRKQVRAEEG